jgi:hypothetical protein
MKRRDVEIYKQVFTKIKALVNFKKRVNIITDTEKAAICGYSYVFKNFNYYRCLTHFSKNVQSKIVNFGLICGKKLEKNERLIFNLIKSLVFVPTKFLTTEVNKIENIIISGCNMEIARFFDSFKEDYMRFESGNFEFKEEFYAVNRLFNYITLTTNYAEGFNAALNSNFERKLELRGFVRELCKFQSFNEKRIEEILKFWLYKK